MTLCLVLFINFSLVDGNPPIMVKLTDAYSFNVFSLNSLSANPTKWSNTLKQFVGNLPTNCLSVFDHFVKLAPKGLTFNKLVFR